MQSFVAASSLILDDSLTEAKLVETEIYPIVTENIAAPCSSMRFYFDSLGSPLQCIERNHVPTTAALAPAPSSCPLTDLNKTLPITHLVSATEHLPNTTETRQIVTECPQIAGLKTHIVWSDDQDSASLMSIPVYILESSVKIILTPNSHLRVH